MSTITPRATTITTVTTSQSTTTVTTPTGTKMTAVSPPAQSVAQRSFAETLFGLTTLSTPVAVATHAKLFPGNAGARAYSEVGRGVIPWTEPTLADCVANGRAAFVSAKDLSISAWNTHWDNMPDAVTAEYCTPFHEINRPPAAGVPTWAAWSGFFTQFVDAARSHKNSARIKVGPILSWYPAAIGHNEGIPWQQVMDLVASLQGDFAGWDEYNPSAKSLYSPSGMVQLPLACQSTYPDVDTCITEFGVQVGTGYSEAQAQEWFDTVMKLYIAAYFPFFLYWCSQQPGNPNWHLEGRPLQAQYAAAIQYATAGVITT